MGIGVGKMALTQSTDSLTQQLTLSKKVPCHTLHCPFYGTLDIKPVHIIMYIAAELYIWLEKIHIKLWLFDDKSYSEPVAPALFLIMIFVFHTSRPN